MRLRCRAHNALLVSWEGDTPPHTSPWHRFSYLRHLPLGLGLGGGHCPPKKYFPVEPPSETRSVQTVVWKAGSIVELFFV